jgi:hypothetical protein
MYFFEALDYRRKQKYVIDENNNRLKRVGGWVIKKPTMTTRL